MKSSHRRSDFTRRRRISHREAVFHPPERVDFVEKSTCESKCFFLEGVDTLDAALDAGFVAEMKEKIRMHVAVRLNLVPSGNEKDTRRFLN